MAHVNTQQEKKELEALKPKISKSKRINDELEKHGKFYDVPNLAPKTTIFIKDGENVKESLENYAKKLTNQNKLYKIRV